MTTENQCNHGRKPRSTRRATACLGALVVLALLPGALLAKRYVVDRTDDPEVVQASNCSARSSGTCSLRDALAAADETTKRDTVFFGVSGPIYLTRKLTVAQPVKIEGGRRKTVLRVAQAYTVKVLADRFSELELPTLQPAYSGHLGREAMLELAGDRSSVANMVIDGSITPLASDVGSAIERIDYESDGETDSFLFSLDIDSDGVEDRWLIAGGISVDFPRCAECTFELDDPGSVAIIGNVLRNFDRNAIHIVNSHAAVIADNDISGGAAGRRVGGPSSSADAIGMFLASNPLVSGNTVEDFRNGFTVSLGFGATIVDNVFAGNVRGIEFDFGGAPATYSLVARNQVVENSETGIYSLGQSGASIVDNVVSSNGQLGILLAFGSNDNQIADNEVSNNGGFGVVVHGSIDNSVSSNRVRDNGSDPEDHGGIVLVNGSGNSVRSNELIGNSGFGVAIDGSHDNEVGENVANDNGGAGFAIVRGAQSNLIELNQASGNAAGVFAGDADPFPEGNVYSGNELIGNSIFDVADLDPVCNDTWEGNTFETALVASGVCVQ